MRALQLHKSPSLITGKDFTTVGLAFRNFGEQSRYLRAEVERQSANMALRELTLSIIFPACAPRDEYSQALAIGSWVQEKIRYVHEGRETFQRPETTLRLKAGDCDDHTLLIASMLGTVGIKNRLCIVKIRNRWAHIFPVAIVLVRGEGHHRLTLDSTLDEPIEDLVNPIQKLRSQGIPVTAILV